MNQSSVGCAFLLVVLLFWSPVCLSGAEEDQETGVKKYGVVHDIAEDRKINRVGGIYEPEGLDRYLKRKFDTLFQKLDAVESRLRKVEENLSGLQESFQELSSGSGKRKISGSKAEAYQEKPRAALVR